MFPYYIPHGGTSARRAQPQARLKVLLMFLDTEYIFKCLIRKEHPRGLRGFNSFYIITVDVRLVLLAVKGTVVVLYARYILMSNIQECCALMTSDAMYLLAP